MAGHIIAVVGGKGGVGKSVFAANLAIAYLQESKQRPLIVDLDLNSLGDQNIILGQNPPKNIVDVSRMPPGPVDAKSLGPFLANAPAGYSYIAAPRDSIVARDLDMDGLGRFLKGVTNVFNLTVVDCGSAMEPWALKTLEYATAIFVVTNGDVIVINQTKRVLAKIQELLFPPEMVQVIINRYSPSNVITPQIIQKNLNRAVFAAIPEDAATCDGSLTKSVPICLAAPNAPVVRAYHDVVRKMQQVNLLETLARLKKPTGVVAKAEAASAGPSHGGAGAKDAGPGGRSKEAPMDAWTAMKLRIHKALVEQMDLKKTNTDTSDPKQKAILREKTNKVILDILANEDTSSLLTTRELKQQIINEVLDEALGLGPLEDLLKDDNVTEIMVNARDQIYIEKAGKPMLSKVNFSSEQQMMNVIERIVTPLGRRVDEKTPYVDARLADGSRVHVIIPPLALRGPTITIRKFPKKRIGVADLIKFGSMTEEIADFLRCCVEAKLNIVVSGGTGSGKTTLLNVLSGFIPASERIITVEDAAELQLVQEHVVRLESRPKNIEGEGEVSIRDLLKCCLRMRPDRIVVGECRDGSALDMLQAMNTGHSGSLTTVHSNNPRESIGRLETLVMMAGLSLPSRAIKESIASAVGLIIQQSRLNDGTRRVTHITEVVGMQGEVISLQDIFIFKQEGLDKKRQIIGHFEPTGFVPKFVEEMEAKGMRVSRDLFKSKPTPPPPKAGSPGGSSGGKAA
ncbi:MAG: ATPase, T2SS/T4P/T4SS family [Oligoflexia bacterium]|nr:ATPase, T2SS/T4P/T4SS family [Oligoflexia bacterium]